MDVDDPEPEAQLLRRLDDPRPSIEVTPQFWEDLRQRVRDRRGRKDSA
jgi:hypothetical protein